MSVVVPAHVSPADASAPRGDPEVSVGSQHSEGSGDDVPAPASLPSRPTPRIISPANSAPVDDAARDRALLALAAQRAAPSEEIVIPAGESDGDGGGDSEVDIIVLQRPLVGSQDPRVEPVSTVERLEPIVSYQAPELRAPLRKLRILTRETLVRNFEEHPWVPTPNALGSPVVAGGVFVGVYAAARVLWHDAADGVVSVEIVYGPLSMPEHEAHWRIKLHQKPKNPGEPTLYERMMNTLQMILSRIPLAHGIVIRFVGGSPMDRELAMSHGYHYWEPLRSPTRVEIDYRGEREMRDQAMEMYYEGEKSFVRWCYWRFFDAFRYRQYCLGRRLVANEVPKVKRRIEPELLTAAGAHIGPLVSSLSAVALANDPNVAKALKDRRRGQVHPTVVGDDRPTYMTHIGPSVEIIDEE
jgi:hypothetical protein